MMKTPEQLKGAIRNMAKKKGIHAQEVLQIFMFERIIERLSVSPYKDSFILKGGLLISAILGVAERTTMDMDTTVKGLPMDEQSIQKAIREILDQTVDDGIEFQLLDLTPIREDDEYENFRASIQATYIKNDFLHLTLLAFLRSPNPSFLSAAMSTANHTVPEHLPEPSLHGILQ